MPPTATMFLHRKLVGVFLLLARLGARVPTSRIVRPYLELDRARRPSAA